MAPKYELLPNSPSSSRPSSPTYPPAYDSFAGEEDSFMHSMDVEDTAPRRPVRPRPVIPSFDSDPRFRVRTPSPFARAGLLLLIVFLFWAAFSMRKAVWIDGGMGMGHAPPPEVDPAY